MNKSKRFASVGRECVACGCCVKVCPKSALQIHLGITARVDIEKCIGCGKCEKTCPAGIITILERKTAV